MKGKWCHVDSLSYNSGLAYYANALSNKNIREIFEIQTKYPEGEKKSENN